VHSSTPGSLATMRRATKDPAAACACWNDNRGWLRKVGCDCYPRDRDMHKRPPGLGVGTRPGLLAVRGQQRPRSGGKERSFSAVRTVGGECCHTLFCDRAATTTQPLSSTPSHNCHPRCGPWPQLPGGTERPHSLLSRADSAVGARASANSGSGPSDRSWLQVPHSTGPPVRDAG
jgi:hypothetical protein